MSLIHQYKSHQNHQIAQRRAQLLLFTCFSLHFHFTFRSYNTRRVWLTSNRFGRVGDRRWQFRSRFTSLQPLTRHKDATSSCHKFSHKFGHLWYMWTICGPYVDHTKLQVSLVLVALDIFKNYTNYIHDKRINTHCLNFRVHLRGQSERRWKGCYWTRCCCSV